MAQPAGRQTIDVLALPLLLTVPETLPHWNDTAPEQVIIAFIENITTQGHEVFPAAEQ